MIILKSETNLGSSPNKVKINSSAAIAVVFLFASHHQRTFPNIIVNTITIKIRLNFDTKPPISRNAGIILIEIIITSINHQPREKRFFD
jgi:hypothetical protein